MKMRVLLPIVLALVAGAGSLVILDRMMSQQDAGLEEMPTKQVVVAAVDLSDSQKIVQAMVELKRLTPDLVPEEHFTDVASLLGRVLNSHVPHGYPVTPKHLLAPGSMRGFEARIPKGYRAVSIKVNEWSSVSGFVVPGSRVDIIAPVRQRNTREIKSKTILQYVEVAAVGAATSRSAITNEQGEARAPQGDRRTVTLFLTPKEAETLHGANTGRLTLALRSTADDKYVEDSDPTVPSVIAQAPTQAQPSPPKAGLKPDRFVQEVYNGRQREEIPYIKVNGKWYRENTRNAYGRSRPTSDAALPELVEEEKPGDDAEAASDEPQEDSTVVEGSEEEVGE